MIPPPQLLVLPDGAQQLLDEGGRRMSHDLLRGGKLFNPPLVHHHHPLAEEEGLVDVVGHEEEGLVPQAVVDPLDLALQFQPGQGIQGAERLVKQDVWWVGCQGPGHADPLLLTTRQLAGVAVRKAGRVELDQLEQVCYT